MLQIHEGGQQWPYNEVVVDQGRMAIEAVIAGRGGSAAAMHARLLQHFNLTSNQLPLLHYRGGGRDPFS